MRIAKLIFIVIAALCGVGVFLAAERFLHAHSTIVSDTQSAELSGARATWYEATVALSFERSVTQVALSLDTPAPPDFISLIERQRTQSDQLFSDAFERLSHLYDFQNGDAFRRRAEDTRALVTTLRAEADALMSQPASGRDRERALALPYQLKTEIERLFAYTSFLAMPEGASSTEERALLTLQALSWETREFGGRARTFYAIASLSGDPIPELYLGEARIDTKRAIASWNRMLMQAEAIEMPAEMNEALQAAERPFAIIYLDALAKMDAAMDAMRAGSDVGMPFTFEEFFSLSNDGLDTVAALATEAGVHVRAYWNDRLWEGQISRVVSGSILLVTILITLVSLFVIRAKLTHPLAAALDVLASIADGDLDRDFRQTRRHMDELRKLWDSMEALTLKLREARDKAQEEREAEQRAKEGVTGELMRALENLAAGDLTYHIVDDYGPAYSDLVANFNKTCVTLREVIGGVAANTQEIASFADQLSDAVEKLSSRTDDQTSLVGETNHSVRDLIEGLNKTARNTRASLETASEAKEKSAAGQRVVEAAIGAMERIESDSQHITDFTAKIDNIASQTNLLSLNAGVEAARAGDAGRGFAIVAQEVRSLAQQASETAAQVKELTTTSKSRVLEGVAEVTETGEALVEINKMVQGVRERMLQIETASRAQSETLERIGDAMEQIDSISKRNAQMSDETSDISHSLREKTADLRRAVQRFQTGESYSAASADNLRKSAVA